MKIGILAAMDKEVSLLLPLMENMVESTVDGRSKYCGNIGEHDICVMKCGIGKVSSALNAYRMIEDFHPDLIINSGVAGGADPLMKVGSVLVATEAAYHDVWCGPGTEWGAMDGYPRRFRMDSAVIETMTRMDIPVDDLCFGLICSGDRFISTPEEVAFIKKEYPDALACDMESTSIAQACDDCGVRFAVIRVVSDTPGQADNISQYKNFWTEAPAKTFNAVRSLIEAIS